MTDLGALLRASITDGATVGIGGAGLSRKPMALLRAVAAMGVTDLVVVSFLGGLDVELLLASGVVAELHSSGVDLGGFGLAPVFRTARQDGTVLFHEWSEGTLVAALEAAARNVPSMPTRTATNSDVVTTNAGIGAYPDPISGELVTFAGALPLDVALLHVPAIDTDGNAHIDGDVGVDGLLARAAARTILTAETTTDAKPGVAAISRIWIGDAVVVPGGSWPTACHPHTLVDLGVVAGWAEAGGSEVALLEPAT